MKEEAKKPKDVLCIDCAHEDKFGYCEAPENRKPILNPTPAQRKRKASYLITQTYVLNKNRDCAYHTKNFKAFLGKT